MQSLKFAGMITAKIKCYLSRFVNVHQVGLATIIIHITQPYADFCIWLYYMSNCRCYLWRCQLCVDVVVRVNSAKTRDHQADGADHCSGYERRLRHVLVCISF